MSQNIILIGMPGAGKSTVGVILAKILGYQFIDSDLIIQEKENRLLKDIIEHEGLERFIGIENRINSQITAERAVIATGGSAVYGKEAMEHFKSIGTIVYIRLEYGTLDRRLDNIKQRGVALREGQNLKELYEERVPLYEKYAGIIVDGENKGIEDIVEEIKFQFTK